MPHPPEREWGLGLEADVGDAGPRAGREADLNGQVLEHRFGLTTHGPPEISRSLDAEQVGFRANTLDAVDHDVKPAFPPLIVHGERERDGLVGHFVVVEERLCEQPFVGALRNFHVLR